MADNCQGLSVDLRRRAGTLRLMKGFGLASACILILLGCTGGAKQQDKEPGKLAVVTESPEVMAYAKFRAGHYPLEAALVTLLEARIKVKKLAALAGGTAKDGFADLAKHLDTVGSGLSEVTAELPTSTDFRAKFKEFDEQRLQAIATGNRLLPIIDEAGGLVQDLAEGAPASFKKEMSDLSSLMDDIQENVESGIKEYGGIVVPLPSEEAGSPKPGDLPPR